MPSVHGFIDSILEKVISNRGNDELFCEIERIKTLHPVIGN